MKIVEARNIVGTTRWSVRYSHTDIRRIMEKPTKAVLCFINGKAPARIECNVDYPHFVDAYE